MLPVSTSPPPVELEKAMRAPLHHLFLVTASLAVCALVLVSKGSAEEEKEAVQEVNVLTTTDRVFSALASSLFFQISTTGTPDIFSSDVMETVAVSFVRVLSTVTVNVGAIVSVVFFDPTFKAFPALSLTAPAAASATVGVPSAAMSEPTVKNTLAGFFV